jgi:putative ABC transport system permease protein
VAGIYQDVTSGGRTAKLEGEPGGTITGYVYYAWLAAGQDPAAIADEYGQLFPAASIVPMGQFVTQTLSFVTNAFRSAALLALVFAVGVAALITTLYLNLQLSREQRRCGVLSALGFSGGELAGQLRLKAVVTVAAGTVLGLVIAATLGEKLVGWALSLAGLGLTSLSFIPNPWLVWLAYPLLLIAAAVLSAWAVSSRLKRDDTSVWLRA